VGWLLYAIFIPMLLNANTPYSLTLFSPVSSSRERFDLLVSHY